MHFNYKQLIENYRNISPCNDELYILYLTSESSNIFKSI